MGAVNGRSACMALREDSTEVGVCHVDAAFPRPSDNTPSSRYIGPSAPPRTAMSRFPVIDSPCPLRIANLPQAGRDHCGHCDRQVHNLDGMSHAQREVFMRSCSGKVCVAYTVHRQVARRNLSLGVGLLATLAGSAAMAGEPVVDTGSSAPNAPVTDSKADPQPLKHIEFIVVGGVENPGEARWSDQAGVTAGDPGALPEIGEMEWLPTRATP